MQTLGQTRWTMGNGQKRLLISQSPEWDAIFDAVTKNADIMFTYRMIYDPHKFTREFLALVGDSWLVYRGMLESLTGSFDGKYLSDDFYNAGYSYDEWGDEDINSVSDENVVIAASSEVEEGKQLNSSERARSSTRSELGESNYDGTSDVSSSGSTERDTESEKNGSSKVTGETKGRNINYIQGLQAYDNTLDNDNIGLLGNDFASNMTDSVQPSTSDTTNSDTGTENETIDASQESTTIDSSSGSDSRDIKEDDKINESSEIGAKNTSSSQDSSTQKTGEQDTTRKHTLHREEQRLNAYDNIAQKRAALEAAGKLRPFWSYFIHLFEAEMMVIPL